MIAEAHQLLDGKSGQNQPNRNAKGQGISPFLPEPKENHSHVSYPYAMQNDGPVIDQPRHRNKRLQDNLTSKIGQPSGHDSQPVFTKPRQIEEASYSWNWDNNKRGRMLKDEYRKQAKQSIFPTNNSRSRESSFEKIGEPTDRSAHSGLNNENLLIKPPSPEKNQRKRQNFKIELLDQVTKFDS